jgi:hypothetical protein
VRRSYSLFLVFLVGFCFSSLSFSQETDIANQTDRNAPVESTSLFQFYSHDWLNLHHFLYQWAFRASNESSNESRRWMQVPEMSEISRLSSEEQKIWNQAVQFYSSNMIQHDLLFNNSMIEIKTQLSKSDGEIALAEDLPGDLRTHLNNSMPIYRKHWFPGHDKLNRDWIRALIPRLKLLEKPISERLARAFGGKWPAGLLRVDVAPNTNWAGAYTTNHPTHIMISSLASDGKDPVSLESVMHEACHATELYDPLVAGIDQAYSSIGKKAPERLWHAVHFYTVGEITREVMDDHGEPDYVPYADRNRFYDTKPWSDYRKAFDENWKPYLDGEKERSAALEGIARFLSESSSQIAHKS